MRFPSLMKSIQSNRRIIAIAFLIGFAFALIFSEVFILTRPAHSHEHSGHESSGFGGDCPTCVQIHTVQTLLKFIATALFGGLFILLSLLAVLAVINTFPPRTDVITLVSLRARLNN